MWDVHDLTHYKVLYPRLDGLPLPPPPVQEWQILEQTTKICAHQYGPSSDRPM